MDYSVLLTYMIKCALVFLSAVEQNTNTLAHATRMKSIKILLFVRTLSVTDEFNNMYTYKQFLNGKTIQN